jgi:cytochrome c oxidase subunit 2
MSTAADFPLQYLSTSGPRGATGLLWFLLLLSAFVVVAVLVATAWGVLARRSQAPGIAAEPVGHGSSTGTMWLYVGVGLTIVALTVSVAWTAATMAATDQPATAPKVTIAVRGWQWWWDVTYKDPADPSRSFKTANEIHIPAGQPVRFELTTGDVIHSFWVPALGGKTDTIPGQTNLTWLEADKPGVYRGQCTEYCGEEHALMGLIVFADQPADYQKWVDAQLALAPPPRTDSERQGQRDFLAKCATCHTVRGTSAGGTVGPDLTHLMSRTTIAAATLPNNVGNLSGWIANPQAIKPGNKMPNLDLSGPQLASIRHYLATLK